MHSLTVLISFGKLNIKLIAVIPATPLYNFPDDPMTLRTLRIASSMPFSRQSNTAETASSEQSSGDK